MDKMERRVLKDMDFRRAIAYRLQEVTISQCLVSMISNLKKSKYFLLFVLLHCKTDRCLGEE